MAERDGARLGDYELIERIGGGGMAEVYRARQLTAFGREVALKIVRADLSGIEAFRARFLHEARAISRLSHPNILPLIEFGQERETLYLVTPLVRGGTLRDLLKRRNGALPPEEAISLFLQLCQAVQYAHEEGIIHRDIKPQNVLLQRGVHVFLADFGIARDLSATQLTGIGTGIGTVDYMAPEQARGQASALSDIYSLGVLLYQLLTGRLPFEGSSPFEVLVKQSNDPLPDPHAFNPALPAALVTILQAALAKNPRERFQSAAALGAAVERACADVLPRSQLPPSGWRSTSSPAGQHSAQKPRAAGHPDRLSNFAAQAATYPDSAAPRTGRNAHASGQLPASQSRADTDRAPPGRPVAPRQSSRLNRKTAPTLPRGSARAASSDVLPPTLAFKARQMPPPSRKKRTILIALLGALALVLIIGGAGVVLVNALHARSAATVRPTPTPTPVVPPGFRLFISPDKTFRIIYPATWQKAPSTAGNGAEFDGPASQVFSVSNEEKNKGDAATSDDTYCLILSPVPQPHKLITLGGQQWTQEECENTLIGLHSVIEGVTYKGNLYLITYSTPISSFSSDRTRYFAPMEQSFTFGV